MSTTSSTKSSHSSHDALSATRLNVEGAATKEVRAHEHALHRTKERRGHAVMKERKEKVAAARVLGLKVSSHGTKLVRKLSMESWDGDDPEVRTGSNAALIDTSAVSGPVQAEERQTNRSSFMTLTLGDLISKPRKIKGPGKHLDFEVIPPIRHVIALDDAETDEPWEYITRASLNDGSAWKGKSYAQAVASAM